MAFGGALVRLAGIGKWEAGVDREEPEDCFVFNWR